MSNVPVSVGIPSYPPIPTMLPPKTTSEPVYTRRGLATFLHLFIFIWCARYFFTISFDLLTAFAHGHEDFTPDAGFYVAFFMVVGLMLSYLAIAITSGRVIQNPRWLYQEKKKRYLFLAPLIIATLYFVTLSFFSMVSPLDLVEITVLILALCGMMSPRKNGILAHCFVPFAEASPRYILP